MHTGSARRGHLKVLHSCKSEVAQEAPQQPRVRVNQARVLSDSSVEHSLVKLHQLRMARAHYSPSGDEQQQWSTMQPYRLLSSGGCPFVYSPMPLLRSLLAPVASPYSQLSSVSLMFMFFLFLFGIGGVFLFSGKLHYRCTEPGASVFVDDVAICGSDADCEGDQTCVFSKNPANGALSYDNCRHSSPSSGRFPRGWVDQMYMLSVPRTRHW